MALTDLIPQDGISIDLGASSRKQALQAMSDMAAKTTGLKARDIFDAVLQRERLGSTGVGQGVAIPHARLPGIDKDFPPEHSWGAEDPALLNSETGQDNLAPRVAREAASEHARGNDDEALGLMDPESGDPAVAGDTVDDEAQAVATTGVGDPDAGPTAEEAAIHVIDEVDERTDPPSEG